MRMMIFESRHQHFLRLGYIQESKGGTAGIYTRTHTHINGQYIIVFRHLQVYYGYSKFSINGSNAVIPAARY